MSRQIGEVAPVRRSFWSGFPSLQAKNEFIIPAAPLLYPFQRLFGGMMTFRDLCGNNVTFPASHVGPR